MRKKLAAIIGVASLSTLAMAAPASARTHDNWDNDWRAVAVGESRNTDEWLAFVKVGDTRRQAERDVIRTCRRTATNCVVVDIARINDYWDAHRERRSD